GWAEWGEIPIPLAYLFPDLPAFVKVRLIFVTYTSSKSWADNRV
ncbi:non-ribosomal peptide synthetase, partial [Pseudomonas sp. S36]|nr:non-ribosomal peptide synthetase [Pseudomonas sp. S36]